MGACCLCNEVSHNETYGVYIELPYFINSIGFNSLSLSLFPCTSPLLSFYTVHLSDHIIIFSPVSNFPSIYRSVFCEYCRKICFCCQTHTYIKWDIAFAFSLFPLWKHMYVCTDIYTYRFEWGNGLVKSNKILPEPKLSQIYVAIWRCQATMS